MEKIGVYSGIALLLVFILAPFLEAVKVSLSPLSHLMEAPYRLLPSEPSFAAYVDMWRSVPGLGRYVANSLFIAACCTIVTLSLATPAAYALERLDFPGRTTLLSAMLVANMFSGAVLLVPLYRLMRQAGMLDSYLSMIVPASAFLLPTAVWMLLPYIRAVPQQLEEAAAIDGATQWQTLRRIVLPLVVPGLVVVAAVAFIGAYAQQFLIALTFNSRDAVMPISVGLFQFFGRFDVLWNQLMAASLVSILPVAVLFALLQRRIVGGLTDGAIKG